MKRICMGNSVTGGIYYIQETCYHQNQQQQQQQNGNAILRNLFFNFFLHDTIKPNSNYKQLPITSAPTNISIITITITQYHVIYN